MTDTSSIKLDGEGARDRFLKAVPTATKSADETLGDVVLKVDGEDGYAEVKVCGASGKGPFTVNQIRPVKFIPCVVLDAAQGSWWVMCAVTVVKEAAGKDRGQHTENPFECMQLAFNAFKKNAKGPFDDAGLQNAVRDAVSTGRPYEALRTEMQTIVKECGELSAKHRERLKKRVADVLGCQTGESDNAGARY